MYDQRQLIGKGMHGQASNPLPIPAYHIVKIGVPALGDPVVPFLETAGVGEAAIGIVDDRPIKPREMGNYVYFGPSKVRLAPGSGTVQVGTWLQSDNGMAQPAMSGQLSIGRALSRGESGDLIDVFVHCCLAPHNPI